MSTNSAPPSISQPVLPPIARDDSTPVASAWHPGRPRPVARGDQGAPTRGGHSPRPEPSPEQVRHGIRRTALVPSIITVPCPVHDAAVGEPCYRLGEGGARGVCGDRIEFCAERVKARIAQR